MRYRRIVGSVYLMDGSGNQRCAFVLEMAPRRFSADDEEATFF